MPRLVSQHLPLVPSFFQYLFPVSKLPGPGHLGHRQGGNEQDIQYDRLRMALSFPMS